MTTIGNESRPAYVYDAETDTWVPIGVGPHTHDEYIDKTIITAKGDIIVGTALDAVARLGVGTTGQVLVVNPSTATGLEWANRQETITGAATTITTADLTASRALASDITGKVAVSSVTATELGYVSGVTSAIQTQLNGKSPTASPTFTGTVTGTPSNGISTNSATNFGYMGLPQVLNPASPYTISAADSGKHIYMTTSGRTITIPANSAAPLQIGTTIVVINAASVTTSISINTDILRLAATTLTGTRTLAAHGMATIVKIAATTWIASGNGLT
jgi:hypothetical protein